MYYVYIIQNKYIIFVENIKTLNIIIFFLSKIYLQVYTFNYLDKLLVSIRKT